LNRKDVSNRIHSQLGDSSRICFVVSSLTLSTVISSASFGSYETDMDLNTLLQAERYLDKNCRYESHRKFLTRCLNSELIPHGMNRKFPISALPPNPHLLEGISEILYAADKNIVALVRSTYITLLDQNRERFDELMYSLYQQMDYFQFETVWTRMHTLRNKLRKKYARIKAGKFKFLLKTHNRKSPTEGLQNQHCKKHRNRRFHRIRPLSSLNQDSSLDTVVNLSSFILTPQQILVLSLGPKFCPVPRSLNHYQLQVDVEEGCRQIRLREFFLDNLSSVETPRFYKKTKWSPPTGRNPILDSCCDKLKQQTRDYRTKGKPKDNMTQAQRQALKELQTLVELRRIRISSADKGGAVVVQDMDSYIREADRQLSNESVYARLEQDSTPQIADTSNAILRRLRQQDFIDENTLKWALVEKSSLRTQLFYHLPKIHKSLSDPAGRPIVSGVNGPTESLSRLIDSWLHDLAEALPSYVKDSTQLLCKIEEWNTKHAPFDDQMLLVTFDIVALYTSIPHNDLETAVRHFLVAHPKVNRPPDDYIIEAIRHVLLNNVFDFDGKMYKQISGTAMGTPMAPTLANLFVGYLEKKLFEVANWPILESHWLRYIDDIFMLWTGGEDELMKFHQHINTLHTDIHFTMAHSAHDVPFLDLKLVLEDNFLQSDLYSKPTDTHNLLHYSSCHPKHVKNSIPYSQAIRLRRSCSTLVKFEKKSSELKNHLEKRGYPKRVIQKALHRAGTTHRHELLTNKRTNKNNRSPFVVPYHPLNPPLRHWLREETTKLHLDSRMLQALPLPPVVGEKNCKSLSRILMPSAVPLPRPTDDPGCFYCTRNCIVCRQHLVCTSNFTSHTTGERFVIRHHLTCESKNIVYLLWCDRCPGTQYVGETCTSLRTRFYQHRSNIRKNTGTHVTRHFNQSGHGVEDMRCVGLEQVRVKDTVYRRRRESFWIHKLRCVHPEGLNIIS